MDVVFLLPIDNYWEWQRVYHFVDEQFEERSMEDGANLEGS